MLESELKRHVNVLSALQEEASRRVESITTVSDLSKDHMDECYYYGWYSEEIQNERIKKQNGKTVVHKFKGCTITPPAYTYWYQGGKKVLVTDVTLNSDIQERHEKSGAIFLGRLDKYIGRSYTKI
jgi:hypothetical protein